MTEKLSSALDDKEPQSQSVGARRVRAMKGIEDLHQLAGSNPDTVIPDLDMGFRAAATAGHKHAAAARCVIKGVAY